MAKNRKRAGFVHLRVKSAYSLLEGAVRPKELAKLAREGGMPAVAVTDINNLFGVYEIADTLAKAGIQPIVGCAAVGGARRRARRTSAGSRTQAAAVAAAGAERDRLSQSHQAAQRRLSGGRAGRLAACEGRRSWPPMPKD